MSELTDPYNVSESYGLLIWKHKPGDMGAKTYQDRTKDAKAFLAEYNAWRNGWCYYYTVEEVGEDGKENEVGGCGGFLIADHDGAAYVHDCIGDEIPEDADVEFRGEDIGTPEWLIGGVKVDVRNRLRQQGAPEDLLDTPGVALDWLEEAGKDVTRLRELIAG